MSIDGQQYERVARYLDGQDERLSASERELAERIRRDEQTLIGLEVAAPRRAMARARRRMVAALARPGGRLWWLRPVVAAEAAAVAALLLVALTLAMLSRDTVRPVERGEVPTSVLAASAESSAAGDLDVLEGALDEFEADIVALLAPSQTDVEIEALEEDVREFLIDGTQDTWSGFSDG